MSDTGVTWVECRRTCLAYSPGGHKAELDRALAGIRFLDRFDVTFASDRPPDPAARRTYHLVHPRRSVPRTLANALQALLVVLRERPELVISTGADVAFPILLIAKLFGARVVFVESGATLRPSLTGRLVHPFADLFVVQWPEQARHYRRAVLASGPLL